MDSSSPRKRDGGGGQSPRATKAALSVYKQPLTRHKSSVGSAQVAGGKSPRYVGLAALGMPDDTCRACW